MGGCLGSVHVGNSNGRTVESAKLYVSPPEQLVHAKAGDSKPGAVPGPSRLSPHGLQPLLSVMVKGGTIWPGAPPSAYGRAMPQKLLGHWQAAAA